MSPRTVHATVPAFRAAVAELPRSARHASSAAGAEIVVVPGAPGWCDRVGDLLGAGRAVVVADPGPASPDEIARLAADAAGTPVVVERPRLRADALAAGPPAPAPVLLTAGCGAPDGERAAVVRDAVGWLRLLGGPLTLQTAAPGQALLVTAAGTPATVLIAPAVMPWLRARAMGPTVVEVSVGEAPHGPIDTAVALATDAGRLELPRRFETSARLALRRAVAALDGAPAPSDLDDLAHDAALAARLHAGA